MKIIISKTDSIGDVILALPICGWIKQHVPGSNILLLCQKMTAPIGKRSNYVDEVIIWDGNLPDADMIIHVFPNQNIAKAAKKKKIPKRIGTSHRIYHWFTCNELVKFSRIKSNLHESQLNFNLLKSLGCHAPPEISLMNNWLGWSNESTTKTPFLIKNKFNIIFHMKSRGSAKEWAIENYFELAKQLGDKFNIILTGTEKEKSIIQKECPDFFNLSNVSDSTGKLSLGELIDFIGSCDGLVACSTGPLHIAGVSGIHTLGLFPAQRPMHAGRWMPLGNKIEILEEPIEADGQLLKIDTSSVKNKIQKWLP